MNRPTGRLTVVPTSLTGRLALAGGALVVALGLFVLVVHTPPVRRAVLRYVVSEVQRRYAIRIAASRLDYNLAALTIGLADVHLAAQRTPDLPFFEADYLRAALASRSLTGIVAFDDLSITGGRVHIVRAADGTLNLPGSSQPSSGEPSPLNVAHISAPRFAVDIADASRNVRLLIPALTIDVGRNSGHVALNTPATASSGTVETSITSLDGGAAFDGRTLKFTSVALRSEETALQVDGVVSVLAANPGMDLRMTGTADAERLARWSLEGELPRGSLRFEIHAAGALSDPAVEASLASSRVEWRRIAVSNVTASAKVEHGAADIQHAQLTIARGTIAATGRVPFDDTDAHVDASWSGIDAGELTNAVAGRLRLAPAGTLAGDFTMNGPLRSVPKWTAEATLRASGGATRSGQLAIPGVTRLRLSNGRWTVDARHQVGNAVPVAFVGGGVVNDADPTDSTIAGRLDIAETGVQPFVRVLRAAGIVTAEGDLLRGGTVSAGVTVAGRIAAPSIEAQVHATDLVGTEFSAPEVQAMASGSVTAPKLSVTMDVPSVVASGEQLSDIRLRGQLAGDVVSVTALSASQPTDSGRIEGSGTYNLRTSSYQAKAEVTRWRVLPTSEVPVAADVDATFTGTGTSKQPQGTGSLRVTNLTWNDLSPGDLTADLQLDGAAAHLDARAPGLNSRLTARIDVAAPYRSSIDLRGDDIDLQKVVPSGSSPTTITGHVSVAAHADLPLSDWRDAVAAIDITAVDARAGELPITASGPIRVRFEAQRVYVDRLDVNAGATRISGAGELPLTDGSGDFTLTAVGDIGEAARAITALGVTELPVMEAAGPLSLRAQVTGSIDKPVVVADVEAGPGSATIKDLSTATDIRVRAHLENDTITVLQAHAGYEGATLDATGNVPLALIGAGPDRSTAAPASLHATVSGVTPAVLRGIADPAALDDVAGTVDLAVNVEAPSRDFARATGDVTLTHLDLQMGGLPIAQRVPTRIVVRDGFARIESWNWTGTGATVSVAGQVRLSDREAAIIANGDIDLRVLAPFVRDAGLSTGGRLTPKLSITGPLDAPRIDGDAALEDGEVRLVDPRIVINGISARAALTRSELTLRELTGSINGGSFSGGGSVGYQPESGLAAHLTADVRDMALDFPAGLRSNLDAMLRFDAESEPDAVAPTGQLSGTVTVLRGAYREPLAVVGGLLTALRTRSVAASGAGGVEQTDAFLRRLALNVRVVTDEDLIVDNNYARAQLNADVTVIGTAAAPAVSGRALLREDGQLFVGRNVYTISPDVPSTIDFVSATTIEPELNIHLTTRAAGHDIELALTGPAESPTVDMTSEGLGQADITALLLTGRTLDQLGTADASFIGTQVIGNLSGEVLGFAGRAVGLDVLRLGGVEPDQTRVGPTAVATAVDPTSRLTFGKSLGSNVDITFSQSLRDSTAQTWIVDYLPTRQLNLRYVLDDNDLPTYGFRHDVSFGGGAGNAAETRAATSSRVEQRIADVTVSGNLGFPEQRIRGVLRLRPRDAFDFGRWQDDRDRLEDFYHQNGHLAARVSASRATNGSVVNLSYVIDAGPQTRIEVSGIDVNRDVIDRIADAWATSFLDELLADEASRIVRNDLLQRGYVRPMVAARVMTAGDSKTLHIDVEPGERSAGTRVRIQAADTGLAEDLQLRIRVAGLEDDVLTNPGGVTRFLTDYLRSRGYLRASVKAAAPVAEDGSAVLPIAVDPGPQFVLATIGFEGRKNVPEEDVQRLFDATVGSPYDPGAIDAARDRIAAMYRSRGFVSAAVTANAAIREGEPSVDLTFEINEGVRQTIGDVVVTGSAGIDTDVVTRALRLTIGSPLEPGELVQGRTRVFNTGLFRRVDVTTEPMPRLSAADPVQPMRIRVMVEPWPALRLRYGFQIAEVQNDLNPTDRGFVPGLSADVLRRTMFGRAVSLEGVLQYERRQNTARALLNAPTLLTLPVQSSLVLERTHQAPEGTTFVSDRNTVSWEQQSLTHQHLTLSYSYRFDRDHTFDTRPATGSGLDFDITVNVASLIGNSAWDTRDDPLNATRGALYSSSVQWAPESLGSQFRFIKYVGQAYRFQNVHHVVLASAARLGLVRPLAGQELLLSQRFFAGGSRTVRGVAENSLGPVDFLGDPAGGEAMLILNQEARIPLYKWLGGVAFIDAGNVFAHPSDVRLNALTGSVGVGLRLATPFALLRADYGKVLWPGSAAGSGRWTFGIGQAF